MLDTYFFWQQTWKREGRMEVSLPRRNDTDGAHLAAQARYALVLDMITRTGEEFWPRYGTAPGCEHEHNRHRPFPILLSALGMQQRLNRCVPCAGILE